MGVDEEGGAFDVVDTVGGAAIFRAVPASLAPRGGVLLREGRHIPVVVVSGFEDRDYGVRARRLVGLDQPGVAGCFFVADGELTSLHRAVCGVRLDELLAALPQPGRLPATFSAWVAKRVALLQRQVNREEQRAAFALADVVLAFDGAVWLCPRPVRSLDLPPWLTLTVSPELARGWRTSPASDVHTVGAVLHTLLAEAGPWPGRTQIEVLQAVLTTPPAPLPSSTPPTLAALAAACLRSDASQRPGLMQVLRDLGDSDDGAEAAFCAGLLGELFSARRRREREWLEELAVFAAARPGR